TVRPIIDSAGAARPLAAFLVPDAPQALAMLSRAGVPNFRTPEACADVIAAALSRQPPRPLPARTAASAASGGPILDELAAGALLDRLGIARAPSVALEVGIARTPPLPFAYPVAVKVLCAEIAHKTEAGGVLSEIARDRSLRLAPIDLATAHEMIAEVRSLIALAGYRGRPAGDLDALAHAMVALSRLADDASIAEAEINPLIVREAGEG